MSSSTCIPLWWYSYQAQRALIVLCFALVLPSRALMKELREWEARWKFWRRGACSHASFINLYWSIESFSSPRGFLFSLTNNSTSSSWGLVPDHSLEKLDLESTSYIQLLVELAQFLTVPNCLSQAFKLYVPKSLPPIRRKRCVPI